jgi:hypothetical protein
MKAGMHNSHLVFSGYGLEFGRNIFLSIPYLDYGDNPKQIVHYRQ